MLDLALPDGSSPPYYLPVVVANNLDASAGSAATETNDLTLTHFTVELSAPGVTWSAACPARFDTQAITETIPPGGSVGVSMDIIVSAHSQCLQAQLSQQGLAVTAKITASGHHGGTAIESAPFVFSINVCAGCLQQGFSDPALKPYQYPADLPACSALTGNNPYTGNPCLPPGQDSPILCCLLPATTGGTPKGVAVCPGVFNGTGSSDASVSSDR